MHEYLLKMMRRRNPGLCILAAGNEAAAPEAAGNGAAAGAAPVTDLSKGAGNGAAAGNASSALQGVPNERITSYIVGLRAEPVETLANFLFPLCPAGLKFEYRIANQGTALMVADDDVIGPNGLPAIISFDGDEFQTGKMQFRGLEFPIGEGEEAAWNNMPGWSADMEKNRRAKALRDAILRGRLLRGLALLNEAQAAQAQGLVGTTNPIPALKADIDTVALAAGDRNLVRIVFGSQVWSWLTNHPLLLGGDKWPAQTVTKQRIADLLELPADNITVSYQRMISSKQGKSKTTAFLFNSNEAYFFAGSANPSLDDPSTGKTFYMPSTGQVMAAYEFQAHPVQWRVGLKYWERMAITNTTALVHRSYTYAAS